MTFHCRDPYHPNPRVSLCGKEDTDYMPKDRDIITVISPKAFRKGLNTTSNSVNRRLFDELGIGGYCEDCANHPDYPMLVLAALGDNTQTLVAGCGIDGQEENA